MVLGNELPDTALEYRGYLIRQFSGRGQPYSVKDPKGHTAKFCMTEEEALAFVNKDIQRGT